MKKIVFDSWPLLAYFEKEPQGQTVKELLLKAQQGKLNFFLSYINLAEVCYQTIRDHGGENARRTLSIIKRLPIELVSATNDLVLSAAEIKAEYSIALGDCFAVALALEEKAPILTGDPEFKKVEKIVKIKWL